MHKSILLIILITVFSPLTFAEILNPSDLVDVCNCEELKDLTKNIEDILTESIDGEADELVFLMEIFRKADNGIKCESFSTEHSKEDLMPLHWLKNYDSPNHEIQSSEIEKTSSKKMDSFKFVKEGQKTLFFRGTKDGNPVYFKLEMFPGGYSRVSFIPVESKKTIEELLPPPPVFKDDGSAEKNAKAAKTGGPVTDSVSTTLKDKRSNAYAAVQASKDDVKTTITIPNEDKSQKISVTTEAKDINNPNGGTGSVGVGYSLNKNGNKVKFGTTLPGEGKEQSFSGEVSKKVGLVEAGVGAKMQGQDNKMVAPRVKVGTDKFNVGARAQSSTESLDKVIVGAQAKIGLSGKLKANVGRSTELADSTNEKSFGLAYKLTDKVNLSGSTRVGATSQTYTAGASYKSGDNLLGIKTDLTQNNDTTASFSPQLSMGTKKGAHKLGLSGGPLFSSSRKREDEKAKVGAKIRATHSFVSEEKRLIPNFSTYIEGQYLPNSTNDVQINIGLSIPSGRAIPVITTLSKHNLLGEEKRKNGVMAFYDIEVFKCNSKGELVRTSAKNKVSKTKFSVRTHPAVFYRDGSKPDKMYFSPRGQTEKTFCKWVAQGKKST